MGNNGILLAALGTAAVSWFAIIAIAVDLGGLANLEPGGWLVGLTSLLAVTGALGLPLDRKTADSLGKPDYRWLLVEAASATRCTT